MRTMRGAFFAGQGFFGGQGPALGQDVHQPPPDASEEAQEKAKQCNALWREFLSHPGSGRKGYADVPTPQARAIYDRYKRCADELMDMLVEGWKAETFGHAPPPPPTWRPTGRTWDYTTKVRQSLPYMFDKPPVPTPPTYPTRPFSPRNIPEGAYSPTPPQQQQVSPPPLNPYDVQGPPPMPTPRTTRVFIAPEYTHELIPPAGMPDWYRQQPYPTDPAWTPTPGGAPAGPTELPTEMRPFGQCPAGQVKDLATGKCIPAVATPTAQRRLPTIPIGGFAGGGGMTYSVPVG